MIVFDEVLRERMRSIGGNSYKLFLLSEVVYHWDELVAEIGFDKDVAQTITAQVRPVKLEHGVLFVDVKNASFKDQLKFYTEEIIDVINKNLNEGGQPLVKEIRPSKSFQPTDEPKRKIEPEQEGKFKIPFEEITLTEEEIQRCEERVKNISDEDVRWTVLKTWLSFTRNQKFRLANGWHKCARCDLLCSPEETFCDICQIKNREEMVQELYKIFYDAPEIKTEDAQKILLERMPHMRDNCFPTAIESARASLIQSIANKVRSGDEDSTDEEKSRNVRTLVALERRLPIDKLTPGIIKRTLIEMQFSLADQALQRRYRIVRDIRRK